MVSPVAGNYFDVLRTSESPSLSLTQSKGVTEDPKQMEALTIAQEEPVTN